MFAAEDEAFSDFFDLVGRFFEEATQVTMRLSLRQLDDAVARFPTFFGYRNATLSDVLDQSFADPRAKAG